MRRCMALLAASARALLQDLLRWQAPKHTDVARQCAQHLSHLFEDIAERKVMEDILQLLGVAMLHRNDLALLSLNADFRPTAVARHALVLLALSCTHVT